MQPLARAVAEAAAAVSVCPVCGNVDTQSPCTICQDSGRDQSVLVVVEDVGDLWALASPFHLPRFHQKQTFPRWLGSWPAVLLFFGFAWAELVWHDKDVPAYLASVVLGYAALTWTAMAVFGTEAWLRNGEAFSVAFGVLGRFAPLYAQGGTLRVRVPGAGLLADERVPVSLAVFVLLMLSSVTCDGFFETPLMRSVETTALSSPPLASALFTLSEWGLDESGIIRSATLAAFPVIFVAAFWLTAWAMVPIAALLFWRHRTNIRQLLAGKERAIGR